MSAVSPLEKLLDVEMLMSVVSVGAQALMIFGGVVPYMPQYLEIRRSRNAEGFSTFVCLTLLVANTLRILFWFGHPFELPLLAQSIIMNVTMMVMVHLCVTVKAQNEIIPSKPSAFTDPDSSASGAISTQGSSIRDRDSSTVEHRPSARRLTRSTFLDFNAEHFWKWTDYSSYIQFMMLFTLVMGAVTMIFLNISIYVETLGFLAVLFEAMLGAPQFYRNLQNKSTEGMSLGMVLMWTSGDVFKTVYFLARQAPTQFWVCGLLQISLDIAILCQVAVYGRGK